MNKFEYDPSKLALVPIDNVWPNDYNPKEEATPEYEKVLKSLKRNGLKQPIFVRELDGRLVIVDGEQRWTAARELGYENIYVYNLGVISEERAKALTIWLEVQVPFDKLDLAKIAIDLTKVGIELPYEDYELKKMELQLNPQAKDDSVEEKFKTLKIRMTREQFDFVTAEIKSLVRSENVSEGRALELLVANKLAGEDFTSLDTLESSE